MGSAPVAATDGLEHAIKAQAYALGFDLVGIASLGPVDTTEAFDGWLAKGYAGEMHYLERGAEKRRDSRRPVDGATSAIVVALNYGGRSPSGPIARYARGNDYHEVIEGKLRALHAWLAVRAGHEVRGKAYVDTGPILERDLARRAGLGWFGKNTMLISPELGSFVFLGALLVELPLEPDPPFEADRCGRCRRCLDACPTDAFPAAHTLDATRCISYLTIELKGAIPEDLREGVGELVYGCDVCQDVCPWNVRFSRELTEPALAPRETFDQATLAGLLELDDAGFRARFRGSPLTRAKRRGVARNAAVALGNRRNPADVPGLARALAADPEPLVRSHAAWALGRFAHVPGGDTAGGALREALEIEGDPEVALSVQTALARYDSPP